MGPYHFLSRANNNHPYNIHHSAGGRGPTSPADRPPSCDGPTSALRQSSVCALPNSCPFRHAEDHAGQADQAPGIEIAAVRCPRDEETRARGRTDRPLAEALRTLMAEHGMSETDLAKKAGLPRSVVTNCLSESPTRPTRETLIEAAQEAMRALDVSPDRSCKDRAWRLWQLLRDSPELAECIYDALVAEAALLDSLKEE